MFCKCLGVIATVRARFPLFCLTASLLFAAASASGDPIDWPTLSLTQVVTNTFVHPTFITHASDGSQRLFIGLQSGQIQLVQNGNVPTQPFLDISDRTLTAGPEQGLLGLAFSPGYSTNGHFYVDYTRKPDGAVVISRFSVTADPNVADPSSETVILTIPKPANNHNGGQLAFGPDSYLYIGVGDGDGETDPQNNGQKTNTLLGKVLRIDVESGASPYAVPSDNPFVGKTGYSPEIWALGLRNPWRFSFDRLTGDLYIADVGQNKYEEIDFQPAGSSGGQNYGWRIMEAASNYNVPSGFTNFSALTSPVTWYSHQSLPTDLAGAVVGGYVYRGPSEPRMDGMYFFADYMAGWIWGLKQDGTNWQTLVVLKSGLAISSFGEDDQGNLYLADYYHGKILQIQDSHQVQTPLFSPTNRIIFTNLVTASCPTTNAVIHYTTNGIDPTESDPIIGPGDFLQVTTGQTNKLRAFRSDLSPSAVAIGIYTNKVATPTFAPLGYALTNGTLISISTATPGASIYYLVNAPGYNLPTTNSPLYTGPFPISNNISIRAIGAEPGYVTSAYGETGYILAQVATPAFNPPAGPITNGTSISMSCSTSNSIIYYTLDGSTPTTNSAVYSTPLTINGGINVKALASAPGYLNSPVQNVLYSFAQTATPAFDPPFGPITNGTSVSITCDTPGSTIYYTTNGDTPTTSSAIYSGPVIINGNTTLNAFATADQHLDSAVQSVFYQFMPVATPVFSPSQGPLTNHTLISITCDTPGATIRYTLDGSDPTSSSPIYSTPITFTNPATLKAQAFRDDLAPSSIQSTFYAMLDWVPSVVTTFAGGPTPGLSNAVGNIAQFSHPEGVCIDSNQNLYVADAGNNVIRKISPVGAVTTFAGTGTAGSQTGPAASAQFSSPSGVCVDPTGIVYVADQGNNRICKIDKDGTVTSLASIESGSLWQIAMGPDGDIYVGSEGAVLEVSPVGTITQLSPFHGCEGGWCTLVGPGVDPSTNIYAATEYKIWKIVPGNLASLYAGSRQSSCDGPAAVAQFLGPEQVVFDSAANMFVSDQAWIRKIRPDGWVSTLAGTGTFGYQNGVGSQAKFNAAFGLCVDTNGNTYVADYNNNCIRKISPDTAGIGIADDWQRAHFGHVGIDPNADPDHDGMSNFAEFWAGTDPLNSSSVLAVESTSFLTNGVVNISWQSVPGKTYVVRYSTDFITWTDLGAPMLGDGSILSVTDSGPRTGQRFYRVFLTNF